MDISQKRLFIIGASILQLPAIKKAKEMGMKVAVADFNPEAVGVTEADEYFNVSTIDEKGVCEAVKKFGADGIMTLATDMPMRSVAYTCEKLGLKGISYDTAVKATDKGEMIKAFSENAVECPWYFIVENEPQLQEIKDKITYPCITKPTDNSGSRGVMLVHNEKELCQAFSYSSENGRSGSVIIEEYMTGSEVSVEVIVQESTPYVLQVTDKLTTGAPHFVEMGHSQPSRLGEENVNKIKDLACRAVKAVGISDGPAHVEIMLTENGPKMVELGARMGGDCITTHLVPLSTGIDMIKATIEISCGKEPDIKSKFDKGSAIRYFSTPSGVIKSIEGIEEALKIEGIREISMVKSIGDVIGDIGSSTDRVGFVIARADTAEKAVAVCEKALETVKISVE